MRAPLPAASSVTALPAVTMPEPTTPRSPVALVMATLPLPAVPLTFTPVASLILTAPVPFALNTMLLTLVRMASDAPIAPLVPPAVRVNAVPLIVPAVREMLPATASRLTLPVVLRSPLRPRLPVVLVMVTLPLPAVPLTAAPSASVIRTAPVPLASKLSCEALVNTASDAPIEPLAPHALKCTASPLTVPDECTTLPAPAPRVTLSAEPMSPPMVRSPVRALMSTAPESVLPLTVRASASLSATPPAPLLVKVNVSTFVSSALPAPMPVAALSVRSPPESSIPVACEMLPAAAVNVAEPVPNAMLSLREMLPPASSDRFSESTVAVAESKIGLLMMMSLAASNVRLLSPMPS